MARKFDKDAVLDLLDQWLIAEDETIEQTKKIGSATENDSIKIFMDIIRTDSAKHKRIQDFLKKALTTQAPTVSFDQIGDISQMVNDHLELEQKTVDYGNELVKDVNLPVVKELLEYLLEDEQKHVRLLKSLAAMKEFAQKNT